MESLQSRSTPDGGTRRLSRLRTAAVVVIPLLLGACPSTTWVVALILPQTGLVVWGRELLALGAAPSLVGVLDAAAADWRTSGGETLRPSWLLGRLVAVALALLAVISAVNLSTSSIPSSIPSNIASSDSSSPGIVWLLLLAFTTVTCSAFITSPYRSRGTGSGALQGILACIGFCLPPAAVLTIIFFVTDKSNNPLAFVVFFIYMFILTCMSIATLFLAPLAGLLGGRLLRSR